MTEGIKKFAELMNTDEVFRNKLIAAEESYKGEMTPEAVYNNVLSPLAREYGISISLEEFNELVSSQDKDQSLNIDELQQAAGGKGENKPTNGGGAFACAGIGVGSGGGSGEGFGGGCGLIGFGVGLQTCVYEGLGRGL